MVIIVRIAGSQVRGGMVRRERRGPVSSIAVTRGVAIRGSICWGVAVI
jgi:hypothetical protein